MGGTRELRSLKRRRDAHDEKHRARSGSVSDSCKQHLSRCNSDSNQHRCVGHAGGIQRSDDPNSIQAYRRTGRHRARCRVSRFGPGRLHQRSQHFRGWRDDSLPWLRHGRLGLMEQKQSDHWREYLMEAGGLGIFMISACVFTVLIEHPGSPVRRWIDNGFLRRMIIGVGMGLTAIGLIYSPWGKQSGAHLNPSVTITFFRLGKLARGDALFYVLAQFAGAVAGVAVSAFLLKPGISHTAVNYAITVPG